MSNTKLYKNLKELRIQHGLTQYDLADILCKDRSLITKYESGKAVPPLDILQQLAKLYNTTVDFLCGASNSVDESTVLKSSDNDSQILYSDLSKTEKELILKLRLSDSDKIDEIIKSLGEDK